MKTGLLLALVLLCSLNAAAQQRPQLGIVVETLGANATACGFSESSIESIAALTLRNNGIATTKELGVPYLYVNVVALVIGNIGCTFHLEVSVRTFLQGQPAGKFKSRNFSITSLCDKGTIAAAPPAETSSLLLRTVETNVKLCLGELEY
jgi:hypothetical protein